MEKITLKTKEDLQKAFDFFGKRNKARIDKVIRKYPCILIGCYSDDIEMGDGYDFTTVIVDDFVISPSEIQRN